MLIRASGEGRRGTMDKSVGKLAFSQATGVEAIKLKLLYEEVRDGHLGFWTCLMWSFKNKKLKKSEEQAMNDVIDRLGKQFEKELARDNNASTKQKS